MKKFVFILIFYFINTSIYSQSFSLKSGLSLSNISASQADFDEDLRLGMIFGAVTQFGDDNIKYSAELLFNQRGNKNDLHFNYLDFGFKGNFFFNDEISINVGPSLSYLFSGEFNENLTGNQSWAKFDNDYLDDLNRLNYNACLGLLYKINDLLSIEYSYNIMINSIYKELENSSSSDLKSSSSIISVSYCFNY